MTGKSLTTGIIVGLLLTLMMACPAFVILQETQVLPFSVFSFLQAGWQLGLALEFTVFAVFTGIATLVALAGGTMAAWRARATTFKSGVYAGALSGTMVGLVLYTILVAPSTAVWAGRLVLAATAVPETGYFSDEWIIPFVRHTLIRFDLILWAALIGALVGGMQGGIVGWLRRKTPPPSPLPTLLDVINNDRTRQAWMAVYKDEALKAGLIAGLMGGAVLIFLEAMGTSALANSFDASLPLFGPAAQYVEWFLEILQAAGGTHKSHLISGPLVLSPLLVFLVVVGIGGVAAFLPKNPPGRLSTRVYAATAAGMVTGILFFIRQADQIRLAIGMLPQFVQPLLNAPGQKENIKNVVLFLSTPQARVVMMYCVWLPCVLMGGVLGTLGGALEGLAYGLFLMLFRLRPVDRARIVRRDLAQHSSQLLPRLYRVFQNDKNAIQVLEHLAFDLKTEPAQARIVAAYHTLASRADYAVEALETISHTLKDQPEWKLRAEIMALHSIMAQGLRADTVAQIAAIAPMPDEQTTALPPLLAKSGEHLSRALNELKKLERVDDLNAKIIFMNNTLEYLRLARIFGEEVVSKGTHCCTSFAEFSALRLLWDHWEEIVLSAVKDMQGRAELSAELKTRKLTFARRLALSLTVANCGLNVAEDVRLRVEECEEEYDVLEGQEQQVDILAPQESRQMFFTIRPHNAERLRVCWKIVYDDALNDDRVIEFADQVEFVEAEKPFQRIFPIPYVTGTPLQSGQMFVGRQDVFEYVREHLLGAYQNNVIVLHGQRRTGKTSVLYRLGDVLADTHICVLIDMQGKAARGEVDFLYSIADDIAYTLENKGIAVDLPPRKDFEESPEFFFRSRFLRRAYEALGGKSLLLMFDEFEELQKRVEDGKLAADIFPYLRNLMQHERQVDFVFAGTHKLEELGAEYWSILFNIAAYKRITFLEKDQVTRLVTQPVAPYGMEYDPLAVERIYQVAAGHPYFTQVVCHELVAYHNETQRNYLTVTDVDAALEHIIERGEAHFKYIWAESSTQQRLVLLALAELLETEEAATPDDVAALLRKRGRPLDRLELPEALANLESRDILMRSDPRSSLYRFRVDLIRRWIYAARPAYEKVV